jgi:hypothetical protein
MLRKRYLQKLMTGRLCYVFIPTRNVEVIYLDNFVFLAVIPLNGNFQVMFICLFMFFVILLYK